MHLADLWIPGVMPIEFLLLFAATFLVGVWLQRVHTRIGWHQRILCSGTALLGETTICRRMTRFFGLPLGVAALSLVLASCSSGGGGGGPSGGGGLSLIGPNGGLAASSDGRASVNIPAGALSDFTAIVVAIASKSVAGNIGTAYDFGPNGIPFSHPVTISIMYDDATLPGGVTESSLRLGTVTNNQWAAVANATVDTRANVVSGTTTHFSIYGVTAVNDSGAVPAAPTGVTVAAGDGQVTLTWDSVSDATSYNVYMASQSGVTKSTYSSLTGGMAHTGVTSPFVHPGLTNGTTYYFVVTAINATGESAASSEVSATPSGVVAVSLGSGYSCALLGDGSVKCWGHNYFGELGNGTNTDSWVPVPVSGLSRVIALSSGSQHACALFAEGTIKCWGLNNFGEIGNGTSANVFSTPVEVSGITNGISVSAGGEHTCALLSDGRVRCWGFNLHGQLGDGTTTNALTPVLVNGLSNAKAISVGLRHSCALLGDGRVQCWGSNGNGQLGNGSFVDSQAPVFVSGLSDAVSIAAGLDHTCALLADSTMRCWGGNGFGGQLGNGSKIDSPTPVVVTGLSGVRGLATGTGFTCALLTNGGMNCWGDNFQGQLGNGTSRTEEWSPVAVSGMSAVINISAGGAHTCALRVDGSVSCWGANVFGQLGNGSDVASPVPVAVTGLFPSISPTVAAGDGQATLTWDSVSDATSYDVYMASQSGVTKSTYSSLTGGMAHTGVTSPFVHPGLTNGTTYYFVVTAINATGESAASSEVSATPSGGGPSAPPTAPTGVSATPGDASVSVTWDAVSDATSYNVYMASQAGVTKTNFASLSGGMQHINVTSPFNHTGLTNGMAYYFLVTAVNANGESTESSEVSATPMSPPTAPAAPTGVSSTAGDGQVTISWDPVSGATSYGLYMASANGVTKSNYATLVDGAKYTAVTSPFTVTCLTNSKTYYFMVTAINATGESAASSEVSATPSGGASFLGAFHATGCMATVRTNHTATLLANGTVLIAGGYNGRRDLASAEVYDPVTGTFHATGSMTTARSYHTATLLANGTVLIAGGLDMYGSGDLAVAEVYDPATGAFHATGSMATRRIYHTATLLANGTVLIAGGWNGSVDIAVAEVYDPATGTFHATSSMVTARDYHTATLLVDGTVLIAGGEEVGSGDLASAEVYDPVTGTFHATGSMTTARRARSATLLATGTVLIAGGEEIGSGDLASAELYDPATGAFHATGSMTTVRNYPRATLLLNGTVLMAGGFRESGYLASAEVYDPATGTFHATGSMATARSYHTATLLMSGTVLIAGGVTNGMAGAEVALIYFPEEN